MPLKSFNNVIIPREVSIGIERILIAPSTQTWSPTRIAGLDNTLLPTGFRDMGAVVEDTVTLTATSEKFRLETGIPKVLQYTAILSLSGKLEAQLHSFSARKMAYALGNVDPVNTVSSIHSTSINSSSGDHTVLYMSTAPIVGLAVGDVLVASANTVGIRTSDNEAQVSSLGSAATTMFVYLSTPGFLDVVGTAWFVGKIQMIAQPFGTAKERTFHILGVADTVDGWQVVHDIASCKVAAGDINDAFKPTENARIQLRFDLFGYTTTRYLPDTELIVAERFVFPK